MVSFWTLKEGKGKKKKKTAPKTGSSILSNNHWNDLLGKAKNYILTFLAPK